MRACRRCLKTSTGPSMTDVLTEAKSAAAVSIHGLSIASAAAAASSPPPLRRSASDTSGPPPMLDPIIGPELSAAWLLILKLTPVPAPMRMLRALLSVPCSASLLGLLRAGCGSGPSHRRTSGFLSGDATRGADLRWPLPCLPCCAGCARCLTKALSVIEANARITVAGRCSPLSTAISHWHPPIAAAAANAPPALSRRALSRAALRVASSAAPQAASRFPA